MSIGWLVELKRNLQEFKQLYVPGKKPLVHHNMKVDSFGAANLPASIDWRTRGAVTPVKDQGQCKIHSFLN
jgi:C1A family cysteine protease